MTEMADSYLPFSKFFTHSLHWQESSRKNLKC